MHTHTHTALLPFVKNGSFIHFLTSLIHDWWRLKATWKLEQRNEISPQDHRNISGAGRCWRLRSTCLISDEFSVVWLSRFNRMLYIFSLYVIHWLIVLIMHMVKTFLHLRLCFLCRWQPKRNRQRPASVSPPQHPFSHIYRANVIASPDRTCLVPSGSGKDLKLYIRLDSIVVRCFTVDLIIFSMIQPIKNESFHNLFNKQTCQIFAGFAKCPYLRILLFIFSDIFKT